VKDEVLDFFSAAIWPSKQQKHSPWPSYFLLLVLQPHVSHFIFFLRSSTWLTSSSGVGRGHKQSVHLRRAFFVVSIEVGGKAWELQKVV